MDRVLGRVIWSRKHGLLLTCKKVTIIVYIKAAALDR